MTNDQVVALLIKAKAELEQTTVGYINRNWKIPPAGTRWFNGLDDIDKAIAGLQPDPVGYDALVAGIQLPAFNPTVPVITCRSQSDIDAAIRALAQMPANEYRKIVVAPGVTYNGEIVWSLPDLPGSYADPHVFWDWGTMKGRGGSNAACFYGRDLKNVLMSGGDWNCLGGPGIYIARGKGFRWVDFFAHDCSAEGLAMFTGFDVIAGFVMKGVLDNNGLSISGDPHNEQGTGVHACNTADAGHDFGDPTIVSTLALKITNQPTGAGVELGQEAPLKVQNLNLYLYGDTIGRALPGTTWQGYAKSQVAGNLLQLWGSCSFTNVKVKWAEGHNLMGRVIDTNGIEGDLVDSALKNVTVEHGRAVNCCLSARFADSSLSRQPQPSNPYDPRHGVKYLDVG